MASGAVAVRRVGDPVLRRAAHQVLNVAEAVRTVGEPLVATLDEFRRENGFGRAIAAPQIGESWRMIACRLDGRRERLLINPRVLWRSEESFAMWDDCFSFPDLMVPVRRHVCVSVAFVSESGETRVWEKLDRSVSELLQHEIDHLDGVLSLDIATGPPVARKVFKQNKRFYLDQIGSDYAIEMTKKQQ
jgi:peptide deformylase